jgi:hydrogenase maturation protease
MSVSEHIVILGVGNLLMSDDGIGPHAAQALAPCPPPGVCVADVGTDFLSALSFLEQARHVLIIDAVRAGGAPGTIYQLTESDMARQPTGSPSHFLNLLEARRLLSPDSPPIEISILGVEPAVIDYGMELSPAVAAALPQVLKMARDTAARWQDRETSTIRICA